MPDAQRRIFDVEYQLYVFELFHQRGINRWSHFVGIPLHMAALYCLLLRLSVLGPLLIATCVAVHLAIILRSTLRSAALVSWTLVAHAALVLLAGAWLGPHVLDGTTLLRSPLVHVLAWPAVQYITHAVEREIPRPWSLEGSWTPMTTFLLEAPWRRRVALLLAAPLHMGVELVSSWRNFLLLLIASAAQLRLCDDRVAQIQTRIHREMHRPDPAFDALTYAAHGQIKS